MDETFCCEACHAQAIP
ncbi:hypothetical protein FPZ08_07100 [Devosia ginsengisoli]|uniref:Uncharacterized protein n=1 Tax=Devosia ginsengisoli TaxID=400770 RepID=A0A5B8LZL9_9HYPH|nr:hypothetical protein FPZ08_07100 [Devosia ginsengisoli]